METESMFMNVAASNATRLDEKLARIRAGRYQRSDFIIADAKDADMGSGVTTAGPRRGPGGAVAGWKSRQDYLDGIAAVIAQDIVDIMLVSVSNLERLQDAGLFRASKIKPAIRANDATDCWGGVRGGSYAQPASRPFRTAVLSRVMYGTPHAFADLPVSGTDLGLYSITFNNDLDADMLSLEAFSAFRRDAAEVGFKYFMEVFNPNAPRGLDAADAPSFLNDALLRSLAGVSKHDRPEFLKIPFNGRRALEELVNYDASLVVGVLGGGAGTTRDAFELVFQAERSGARLALFGRKINLADSPTALIFFMRQVADGTLTPKDAVAAYHAELVKAGIRASRSLDDDQQITETPLQQS